MPIPSQTPEPVWLSKDAARRRLGVSAATFNALIESGRLSVRQIPGGLTRVSEDEIDALLTASIRPARQPAGA